MRSAIFLACLAAGATGATSEEGYGLAGKRYPADPLDELPQSGRITVAWKDVPIREALEQVSKQARVTVYFAEDDPVKVSLQAEDAPLLAVLAELCRSQGWGMHSYEEPASEILIGPSFCPVVDYMVRGPLLLTWHDWAALEEYDGIRHVPLKVSQYRLGLFLDPRSHASRWEGTRDEEEPSVGDYPVQLILPDGREVELRSERPDGRSWRGPQWRFPDREGLGGVRGVLRMELPILHPTRVDSATLPAEPDAKADVAQTTVRLSACHMRKARDPGDPSKELEDLELRAAFDVSPPEPDAVFGENRIIDPEEVEQLLSLFREVHGVAWILEDGGVIPVPWNLKTRWFFPWAAGSYETVTRVRPPGSKVKRIRISWASAYRLSREAIRMEVEFRKPPVP